MSDDSNMGLFGSKDREQRREPSDGTSAKRPYCVDSDSETYDTEGLSIMDINDIIGVHSDAMADTTLESEIEALSEIITESKTDVGDGQSAATRDSSEQEESACIQGDIVCSENVTGEGVGVAESGKSESAGICDDQEAIDLDPQVLGTVQSGVECAVKTDRVTSDNKCNENIEVTAVSNAVAENITKVSILESSLERQTSFVKVAHDENNSKDENMVHTVCKAVDSEKVESSKDETIQSGIDEDNRVRTDEKTVIAVSGISESLQLIGEAYISEDSQETNDNDVEQRNLNNSKQNAAMQETEDASEPVNDENMIKDSLKIDDDKTGEKSKPQNLQCIESYDEISNVLEIRKDSVNTKTEEHLNTASMCVKEQSNNTNQREDGDSLATIESKECIEDISMPSKETTVQCANITVDKLESTQETQHNENREAKVTVTTVKERSLGSQSPSDKEASGLSLEIATSMCNIQETEISNDKHRLADESETSNNENISNVQPQLPEESKSNESKESMIPQVSSHSPCSVSSAGVDNEQISEIDNQSMLQIINVGSNSQITDALENLEVQKQSANMNQGSKSGNQKISESLLSIDNSSSVEATVVPISDIQDFTNSTETVKSSMTSLAEEIETNVQTDNDTMSIKEECMFKEATRDSNMEYKVEMKSDVSNFKSEDVTEVVHEEDKGTSVGVDSETDYTDQVFQETCKSDISEKAIDVSNSPEKVKEAKEEICNVKETEMSMSTVLSKDSECSKILSSEMIEPEVMQPIADTVQILNDECNNRNQEELSPSDIQDPIGLLELAKAEILPTKYENIEISDQPTESLVVNDEKDIEICINKEDQSIKETTMQNAESSISLDEDAETECTVENTREQIESKPSATTNLVQEDTVAPATEPSSEPDDLVNNNVEEESLQHGKVEHQQGCLKTIKKGMSSLTEMEHGIETEEESVGEDMNLVLEPKESELESKASDPDKLCADMTETESTKETEEEHVEMTLSLEPEEKSVEAANPKITEYSNTIEQPTVEETDDASAQKQDSENEIRKVEIDEETPNIIEGTDNVIEMFTEAQSQNTQDIVTSILDNERNVTDFKNILGTEETVTSDIERVLQNSEDMLNKDMDDPMSEAQNIDSLEGLLGLDLIPDAEDSALKGAKSQENSADCETGEKEGDMALLLEQSNRTSDMAQDSDYITDVISSCLTNTDDTRLENNANKNDTAESVNSAQVETGELLKIDETTINESTDRGVNDVDIQKLETNNDLQENDLDMEFEENPLESVDDLEVPEQKLDLPQDILLDNTEQRENDTPSGIEISQPSSEISELESAVKFLQESEEQAMDSPLVLSPKMVESVVNDISKQTDANLFVPDEDICEDTSELVAELQNINPDSISISEAEIISEAAKLENERKLAEEAKLNSEITFEEKNLDLNIAEAEQKKETEDIGTLRLSIDNCPLDNIRMQESSADQAHTSVMPKLPEGLLKLSEPIPKVSLLEERLKEPPKIEIPITEITKVCESPTTPKDSLLIQKDAKVTAYQKMLESPKLSDKSEPKIVETPRKDSEKHDFENVGSPRIILKIAKSAITDCGEPRSPKSPKIRSATNSPNPEDSPGQKLGKIKLKLSKGGHPSIISNENVEEVGGQWHTEGSSSLSPIGMKIKLSKSGDASIVSEKHESTDEPKEGKHSKLEEPKRTESPIGMKIKLSKSGDASIVQQDPKEISTKLKDKLDIAVQGSPKRTDSPIGMKIKLSKSGDASIVQTETSEDKETASKSKDRSEISYDSPKRTDSPLGMKIKLSKSGDASIVSPDTPEDGRDNLRTKERTESPPEIPKRTESPMGMKIKLAKTKGGASIIPMESSEDPKEKLLEVPDVPKRTESPLGMIIKLSKSGDASIIHSEVLEESKETKHKEKLEKLQDTPKQSDLPSGAKAKTLAHESTEETDSSDVSSQKTESSLTRMKLLKCDDTSVVPCERENEMKEVRKESHQDVPRRTESPLGMKIKLSKAGDASIVQTEESDETTSSKVPRVLEEHQNLNDPSLGMKIKLSKICCDSSIGESEKREKQQKRKDTETSLEMKIKLSKSGHPTIIGADNYGEQHAQKSATLEPSQNFAHRYRDSVSLTKDSPLKILKTGHPTILQTNHAELTIEPIQTQSKKLDSSIEISPKRREITISPIESKKSKLEAQLSQILPEVTIQPVMSKDHKQLLFDPKTSLISRQQMNVINQEISITQIRPQKATDALSGEKLKDIICKNTVGSPASSDCEIIEHRPELVIVNENSNSSQDVVIIEEVPAVKPVDLKAAPKKRGRPRRNPIPPHLMHAPPQMLMPKDPLALDSEVSQVVPLPGTTIAPVRENERPKRTCRNQRSYAPPKRGRGRGRGKRKLEGVDQPGKRSKIEQDLNAIESSTMAVITINESSGQQQGSPKKSSEVYKTVRQSSVDQKGSNLSVSKSDISSTFGRKETEKKSTEGGREEVGKAMPKPFAGPVLSESKNSNSGIEKKPSEVIPEKSQKVGNGIVGKASDDKSETGKSAAEGREMLVPPGNPNWPIPVSRKQSETATRHENVSTVQVIDEETRMSAESNSRSQTPARNISAQASENTVNEESQGSVLSTATTESEKVKVKNRRMEINFDPDEGPFTVDKIAEYEWPLDRKGETFMIQEQISQYLGVKSFKRKYPDLKRRVVDMEERNYLRENGLVSEAMCDMGLTAICSSEVLDIMCSDFPDQYEEYRKHMREKQVKEHSKKQKELSAAANAEKNRIDLAEMAIQSALTWNMNLNKARRETRKYSLDLQTFTIHVPKKPQKVDTERKVSHYPVALIPGQYTDYYREYTPAELRYYPLNTVLYGPMRPNERKFDSQSEGSQSDSDSDSSSDDSSSSSSEGTQDTEGSQSTMDDVDMEIATQKEEVKLKCKMCLKTLNKHNKNEILIQCGTCNGHVHPSCIDLTLDMVPHIQSYSWQCTDCKTCAQCHDPADEDKMLFCDMCDRGYHIYCVGLRRVPQGRWHCQECAVCANCGSREPGGANSDRNSVAQWQHEYKKGDKNTRVYVSTLCVPCSKLWRKGRYCPHCSRCHTATRLDLEANLVHCSACDKYLHLGCVETKGVPFDRKSYLCDFCALSRQQTGKSLASKTVKT